MKKIISAKVKEKALWKVYLNELTEKFKQYPTKYVIIPSVDGEKITLVNTDSENFGEAYVKDYSTYEETLANAYKNLLDRSDYVSAEMASFLKKSFFNLRW